MSEKKLESIIRDFDEAFVKGDVEKMLSFFAEDGVLVAPQGTFKGKEELKRSLTWLVETTSNKRVRDAGIGIMVKGNKAVHEHVFEAVTLDGMKYEILGACVYEFSGEKIQQHTDLYDRLSIAKQAARGWLEKKIINAVVNRMEKGLR